MENSKVNAPAYDIVDLIPPTHKHTFALEIYPSEIIDDEAEFQSLTGLNWASRNFQTMEEGEEELAQDDPEASTRQGQDN